MRRLFKFLFSVIFIGGLTFLFTANNFVFWAFASNNSKRANIVNSAAANYEGYVLFDITNKLKISGGGADFSTTANVKLSFPAGESFNLVYEGKDSASNLPLTVYVKGGTIYTKIGDTKSTMPLDLTYLNSVMPGFSQMIAMLKTKANFSNLSDGTKVTAVPTVCFAPFYVGTKISLVNEQDIAGVTAKTSISYAITLTNDLKEIIYNASFDSLKTNSKFTIKKLSGNADISSMPSTEELAAW